MARPPWTLTGEGYIFLYRFPKAFVEENGFIPDYLQGKYRGGFGTVMLVDYHQSPVGPYREVLFIPGLFEHAGRKLYSITKIYVSTIDSVIWGQDNWGIPKELAEFTITPINAHSERFQVRHEGRTLVNLILNSRALRVPVNTRWSPLQPGLIQHHQGSDFVTRPTGKGKIGLASIEDGKIDASNFPDFGQINPLAAIRATDFTLQFPVPEIIQNGAKRGTKR